MRKFVRRDLPLILGMALFVLMSYAFNPEIKNVDGSLLHAVALISVHRIKAGFGNRLAGQRSDGVRGEFFH